MFEKQFDLRYFDMGKNGIASPVSMLTLLEEAAADHCLSIGHSLYDLLEHGIGWVLLSGKLQMDRYPSYKEKITIRTWLSNLKSIRGTRENIIFDKQGDIIGRAKGFWLFFNIKQRRPIQIIDDMLEKWNLYSEESIGYDNKKIESIESAKHSNEFRVHRFDMDENGHANNLKYLQWAMESIPDEIMDHFHMHSVEGHFMGEAQQGQTIESLSNPVDNQKTFIHTIRDRISKKVYSTAKTIWKEKL